MTLCKIAIAVMKLQNLSALRFISLKLRPAVKIKTEQIVSRGGYLWDRNRLEKEFSTASMTCIMARDSKRLK